MPGFDVFVSYNRADQATVEQLGRALRARGLTVFVDRWYLVAGQSWPETLEQRLGDCRAVAVCIGASGLGAWQQREHYQALDRQAHEPGFPVIPVLLPGVVDPALGFLGLNTWVDLRQGLDDGVPIEILARAARGLPPGDEVALAPDPRAAICPYRGLFPFREEDAAFFTGREDFTATLIDKVRSSSLVAVVGPSGSGKSSVVRAGLVPALRRGANNHVWEVLTLTPGPTPLHALLAALSPPPEDISRAARLARIEGDVALLHEHSLTIDAFARDILGEQPGTDRLLLVVDQWEEIYTQAKSTDDRQRFLDLILQATADGAVTVVLTLRGDFYGRALEERVFADRLQNAVVNLGPMRREELKRAVTEPAAQVGLGFEDGLVDRILEEVGSEPGNLPLLEFLLTELWAKRERGLLTHGAYVAIGGVRGAIATRAEAELEKLTLEQREALRRVMIRLVTPGEGQADMRARAQVPPGAATEAIRLFADARLLTTGFDEATGHETVEVSHEALIREWSTYRGWVDADREFLRTVERVKDAMRAWAEEPADQDSRLLAPGRPLEEARELLSRPHAPIDDIRPFIEASIAHDNARLAEEQRRIEAEKQREIEQARKVAAAERGRDSDMLGTVENAARVWDAATGKEVAIMRGHDSVVISAAFSPDGKIIVTASLDRTARLWEAETGREIATLRHEAPVVIAAFSPDGKTVLTAPYDQPARLWDASTGKEIVMLRGHDGPITFATFSPDGNMVVTASLDMTGRLWETATGKSIATFRGHEEIISSIAFNPEATIVATASVDGTARLWDTGTGREIAVLRGHHGGITAASFSPDGKTVATGSGDRTVRLWTASGRQEISTLRGHTLPINFVDFSPDGKTIATASWDGTARLWELVANKVLVLRGHRTFVFSAVFSPDGGTVVTASEDQTARLWDTATGEETVILRGHDQRVGWATFSPDGRIVVTASHDGTGRLWESASGRQTAILHGHKGVVFFADFSPDGRAVVTSSYDKTARLWDAATGQEIAVLEGHQDRLAGAYFSPDGRTVVTASDDKTARLWDVATGKIVFALHGHEDRVTRTRISPDGKTIATASADKTVRLWDAATGQEIGTLRGHEAQVQAVAFSPDSKTLVTASAGHTARVWRTERPSLGELISEACQRLARIDQAPQHCQSAALDTGASSP